MVIPEPININEEWVSMTPSKPLEAITGGAAIYIDITNYVELGDFRAVKRMFPKYSVEGELIVETGESIKLSNAGGAYGKEDVMLIVASEKSIPTNKKYTAVNLRSKVPLKAVNVYWRNGKH